MGSCTSVSYTHLDVYKRQAKVRLIQIQLLGTGYAMLNDVGISCAEGASAEVVQLFLGSEKTYSGCQADLAGRGKMCIRDRYRL